MAKKLGETLIISEELLKLYSPISKNVGVDRVFPYVHLAQPYYITPIVGQPLMEELQEQVDNNTLTTENKALILKIAMPLAMWTSYLAVRGLGYSFTQKGLTKEKSENSESVNEKEMGEYILSLKNQAEMATDLLIAYLCGCRDLYPLWRPSVECNCAKYDVGDGSNKNTLHNLIYFPKKAHNGCVCNQNKCIEQQITDVDVSGTTMTINEFSKYDCKPQRTDVDTSGTTMIINEFSK